jgi:hypothetical protein
MELIMKTTASILFAAALMLSSAPAHAVVLEQGVAGLLRRSTALAQYALGKKLALVDRKRGAGNIGLATGRPGAFGCMNTAMCGHLGWQRNGAHGLAGCRGGGGS